MREQGRIQGGNQSVQALGRVLGPLYGGFAYTTLGATAAYWSLSLVLVLAAAIAYFSVRVIIGQPQKSA